MTALMTMIVGFTIGGIVPWLLLRVWLHSGRGRRAFYAYY